MIAALGGIIEATATPNFPSPTDGYTEWGYLGGLIFIVVAFLTYLWRRDKASAQREKTMQDFFGKLFTESKDATNGLMEAIQKLVEKFDDHDKFTTAAIAKMEERTRPQPPRTAAKEPNTARRPRRAADE